MRRGNEIIGLPIIDLATGQRIAEVKDLLCDEQAQLITGLLVDKGNLWRKSRVIPWENVYSVGHDAVTVIDASAIKLLSKTELSQSRSNRYIGKQVLTTSGQYLGKVNDVAINVTNGRIVGCVLTDGLVGDFISGRAIIPLVDNALMSAENMIVPDEPVDLSYKWGVQGEDSEMPYVQ